MVIALAEPGRTRRSGAGRRPGKQDTRGAILTAARKVFAEHGFEKASIRMIAAKAEVDPALVLHYFNSKEELFLAVVELPFDPDKMIAKVYAQGEAGLAERLVRLFLCIWDGPTSGPVLMGVLRSAASNRVAARLMRELFATQIVRRVREHLSGQIPPEEIPLRASFVGSQLFGLALSRYIMKIEPLASADPETIVAAIAPNIHRYLFEPLGLPGRQRLVNQELPGRQQRLGNQRSAELAEPLGPAGQTVQPEQGQEEK